MAWIPLTLAAKVTYAETLWVNQVYSERAQAIRELKTWVLLPLDCTSGDLKIKLKTLLITITDGNWGALEQRPLPTTPELPFFERFSKIGRKILIAVSPLALFLSRITVSRPRYRRGAKKRPTELGVCVDRAKSFSPARPRLCGKDFLFQRSQRNLTLPGWWEGLVSRTGLRTWPNPLNKRSALRLSISVKS
jgi:hypothetical protein